MTKPAWYGGNKIPDSYLKKFWRSVEDEGIPHNIRLFLDQLTSVDTPDGVHEHQTAPV